MSSLNRHILLLLAVATSGLGVQFFQQPSEVPTIDYDFIVVGGGTAGLVVATRLGEEPDLNVLVIEAGLSNEDVFDVQVPGLVENIGWGTIVDWNYTTTPQSNLNDREVVYPRAKILGGCSSHNGLVYTRGSRDDYNRWAAITRNDSLSWGEIFPYILKAEKWSGPNDPSLPEKGHYDPSFHNVGGKLGVTAPYYEHPFNDLIFEATQELSSEFPLLHDLNSGRPIGLGLLAGWSQSTLAHGLRSSSATSYLATASDNVHVLLHSLVTRVLPIDTSEQGPGKSAYDFRGVEVATSPDSPKWNFTAKKEVIVSAGMINTPQLLLLSGIGPQDELKSLGITAYVDIPSVGKNFSDQLSIGLGFGTDLPNTERYKCLSLLHLTDTKKIVLSSFDPVAALNQWKANHTGPLALARHLPPLGWVRLSEDSKPFRNGSPDPTGGPSSPHIEYYFVQISPVNGGSITLATTSPFDQPNIDPALRSSEIDTAIILEGYRSAERLMGSHAFSDHITGLVVPLPLSGTSLTDQEFVQYLRTNATHFGHGVGSCSMAPRGASWGVVDPSFRVQKVTGLRIVDASVLPFVPSGHTQAAVYAIAELASEVIKRSY
ncbi:hypothetical protein NP233_g6493 [Leucocoprinus birnbaumii]|uniref:pyranose dehydrogenase (acceptor) n=1 Tax=Leucocoprinus birnbaumii TaxID=56174 RepID=A0AAD5VQY5_9AGAR|nr:hypothetical protein NP233_g6493 [Leucocoprinus birnbaumii]